MAREIPDMRARTVNTPVSVVIFKVKVCLVTSSLESLFFGLEQLTAMENTIDFCVAPVASRTILKPSRSRSKNETATASENSKVKKIMASLQAEASNGLIMRIKAMKTPTLVS